jgi:cysteine desulfurase
LDEDATRLAGLRERITTEVLRTFPNAYLFGHPTQRLPGHLSFGFRGQERVVGKLLAALDRAGIAVSAGSACSAHHGGEPSGVLLAMGCDAESARGLIRVSLGRFNTHQEVSRFIQILFDVMTELLSNDHLYDYSAAQGSSYERNVGT